MEPARFLRLTRRIIMSTKTSGRGPQSKPMTQADASRIQSAQAKANNGIVAKNTFAARAARAAAGAVKG
jgi:hypothetical protein